MIPGQEAPALQNFLGPEAVALQFVVLRPEAVAAHLPHPHYQVQPNQFNCQQAVQCPTYLTK